MNKPLRELQECFQAYILEANQDMQHDIAATANNSTLERLNIYRNGYQARLLEILAANYPVVKKILGSDSFDKLAREYVNAYPSTHFSIRVFGRHFSRFLTSQRTLDPILVEMANFEWLLLEAQDAPNAPCLTFETVSQIPPESWATIQFKLHPSLRLTPFHYNTPALWQALDQQQERPPIERQRDLVYWRLWRMDITPYFAPLSAPELCMLRAIQADKNFGDICELLCEWFEDEEVIQFAATSLRTWITDHIISEVHLLGEDHSVSALSSEAVSFAA